MLEALACLLFGVGILVYSDGLVGGEPTRVKGEQETDENGSVAKHPASGTRKPLGTKKRNGSRGKKVKRQSKRDELKHSSKKQPTPSRPKRTKQETQRGKADQPSKTGQGDGQKKTKSDRSAQSSKTGQRGGQKKSKSDTSFQPSKANKDPAPANKTSPNGPAKADQKPSSSAGGSGKHQRLSSQDAEIIKNLKLLQNWEMLKHLDLFMDTEKDEK